MATTSSSKSGGGTSTSTRKSSTSKTASTTTREDDTTSSDPAVSDTSTEPATAGTDQATNDPAAALKAKLRTTQHVGDTRPDELTTEQRENLLGAPAGSLPGPRTLATPTAPTRKGEEYVTADTDGYVAFLPDRVKQPATVRVWVAGQRVRKDMHDALSGVVTASAADAPVLTGDEYTQVANFL